MNARAGAWLAWSLAALSVIMFIAAIALHVLARSLDSAGEWSALGAVGQVLGFLPFLAFPRVGDLFAWRCTRNTIAIIMNANDIICTFGNDLDANHIKTMQTPA